MIIVTHEMAFARDVADQVIFMAAHFSAGPTAHQVIEWMDAEVEILNLTRGALRKATPLRWGQPVLDNRASPQFWSVFQRRFFKVS